MTTLERYENNASVSEDIKILFYNVNTCILFAKRNSTFERRCKRDINNALDFIRDGYKEIEIFVEDGVDVSDDMKRFLYNRLETTKKEVLKS